MYHIVLNSDENYIKYSAVLILSIIKNTNKSFINNKEIFNHQEEYYHFHILSADISTKSELKLGNLEKEINKEYPCKITIYKLDDSIFKEDNLCKLNGNYNTYFRLLIPSILPNDIKLCLYLDVDLLCVGDIRELYSLDIKDVPIAAFAYNKQYPPLEPIYTQDKQFHFLPFRFNSGVMLINLELYRKLNIEKKCFDMMKKYIIPRAPDELILNAVIGNNFKLLSAKWNATLLYLITDKLGQKISFNDYQEKHSFCSLNFSKKDFEADIQDVKIIHFTGWGKQTVKPWQSYYTAINFEFKPVHYLWWDKWWDMALKTPFFSDELKKIYSNLKNNELKHYSEAISYKIKNLEKLILENSKKLSDQNTKITNLENSKKLSDQNTKITNINTSFKTAKARVKNHLSYKLGQAMIINSKSILGYIRMPFVLSYIKDKHKQEQKIYQEKIKKDPSLKLPPLESYPGYKEALKEKECFTYKLGEALIRANNNWYGGGISNCGLRLGESN
ncbi:glycosyltransferase family 8 protein [Campylobacter coli]|nr:glycosyltransferase family 8 protein [Campylobacter coli]